MENIIIIAVIILMIVTGMFYTIKHFKGESGCCGSSNCKPRKKKLKHINYTRTFRIEGMHCQHCKYRVEEIVNDINGIAGKADLKKGELTVFYSTDIDNSILKSHIDRAGYNLKI